MIDIMLITGLVLAFNLSLQTMGFSLQHVTLGIPNIAHGAIIVIAAYVAYLFYLVGCSPYLSLLVSIPVGVALTLVIFKTLLYAKKRGSSKHTLLIITLAYAIIFFGISNIFAAQVIALSPVVTSYFVLNRADFSFFGLPGVLLVSGVASFGLAAGFGFLLMKTKLGIAMRAVIENAPLAETQGVDTNRVIAIAWVFSGALAGLSGVLYSLWFVVSTKIWMLILIRVLCGCVVGGIDKPHGAFLGGFAMGLSEILIITALAGFLGGWITGYRLIIPVLITCVVLLIAPTGVIDKLEKIKLKRFKIK